MSTVDFVILYCRLLGSDAPLSGSEAIQAMLDWHGARGGAT
jgi:hypothetical protein